LIETLRPWPTLRIVHVYILVLVRFFSEKKV